jgi:transcriptional regulator with XRE-family HTH domain
MVPAPPIRRRLVGKALRRARESQGFALGDAARVLECDPSKISRIETGQRGIRGRELRELLDVYGIGDQQQSFLVAMADPRGSFGWYRDYVDVLPGAWQEYLILEAAASSITVYEAQRIPALLQTRAYAWELAKTDSSLETDAARDRAADAVLARQHAIYYSERIPEIRLIIGEAALRQQIGSPEIMREQLKMLGRIVGGSTATVQVLPFDSGAHAATGDGSLSILHIKQTPGLGAVHLGGIGGGVCLEDEHDLIEYAKAFDQLRAFAHTPTESERLLRNLADS